MVDRDAVRRFFAQDRFARELGIELVEIDAGTARVRLTVGDRHRNAVGLVHGGVIFSLADLAFAVASNSHGRVALAIHAGVDFFKAVKGGTLWAEAREVSLHPRLATYAITVTDDAGDAVAAFQGTVYRKKDSIPEA